jgi:hypothetical protein
MKTLKSEYSKIFVFTALILTGFSGAQAQTVDCAGTIRAWQIDVSLREFMATHTCTCPSPNRPPVCVSNSEPAADPNVPGNPNLPPPVNVIDPAVEQAKREALFQAENEKLKKLLKRGISNDPVAVSPNQPTLPLKPGNTQNTGANPPGIQNAAAIAALREATVKRLKELNCSAFWGLKAAKLVLAAGDEVTANLDDDFAQARLFGEFSEGAEQGKSISGCPEVKISLPDVPPSLASNPQILLYDRIVKDVQYLLPDIIATKQDLSSVTSRRKYLEETIAAYREEKAELVRKPDTPQNRAEKKKLDAEQDELVELARQAQTEAEALRKTANEQKEKISAYQNIFDTVAKEPARAGEFLNK